MKTNIQILKNLLQNNPSQNKLFLRNLVKEYFQIFILDFIYSHPTYAQLIFYGGSCLRHCYQLPRLSEDLDFVDLQGKVKLKSLAQDLQSYLTQAIGYPITIKQQKFRISIKIPLLKELNLSSESESDLIFLKVEIFSQFNFCHKYQIEMIPLFKFNQSILIRTFDLPTLMSTKIRAVLYRKWKKINKTGQTIVKIKGRDFFDLVWYLQKGIKPNLDCLENIKNIKELKEKLLISIQKIDSQSVKLDLEPLISDHHFTTALSSHIKDILIREIQSL